MTRRIRLVGWAAVRVALGLCLAWTLAPNDSAADVTAGKQCSEALLAPGAPIDCTANYGWAPNLTSPPFETTFLRLLTATDVTDTSGNGDANESDAEDCVEDLAANITGVVGNAICTQAGSPGTACDPTTPSSCTLPCLVCEPLVTSADAVTALSCPGSGKSDGGVAGSIRFAANECTTPAACGPAPEGTTVIDEAIFTGRNASNLVRNARPGASSLCVGGCPDLTIDKTCDGATVDGQCTGSISIQVSNLGTATATATNCTVQDILDPDGAATPVTLTPDGSVPFDLAPGDSLTFTAQVPIDQTTDNEARISCDPSQECLTEAVDRDPCECGVLGGFKCYIAKLDPSGASFRFVRQTVSLEDQFSLESPTSATLLAPVEFCNPVDKNGEGIEDPQSHLMCYKLSSQSRPQSRTVLDRDQFGDEQLLVGGSIELCAPAIKNSDGLLSDLQSRANHYQCYRAATAPGTDPLTPGTVTLADQFETKSTQVGETALHCNPVNKNGGGIPDPAAHLKCYDISDAEGQDPFRGASVTVEDQFGLKDMRVGRATRLCEAAEKVCVGTNCQTTTTTTSTTTTVPTTTTTTLPPV